MADETKEAKCCAGGNKVMAMLFKVILGIVFLGLGVLAIVHWFVDIKTVIKGCIGPILILAAIITFAIAKE